MREKAGNMHVLIDEAIHQHGVMRDGSSKFEGPVYLYEVCTEAPAHFNDAEENVDNMINRSMVANKAHSWMMPTFLRSLR
jgi:hypothetical protein